MAAAQTRLTEERNRGVCYCTHQGSAKACTAPPLPSVEFPEVTNSIRPTGTGAELSCAGMSKILKKAAAPSIVGFHGRPDWR